jgi:amyloid beta precursor protein binding protein 1
MYKTKAREDVIEVTEEVRELEKILGKEDKIPGYEIEAFCKNAAHIKIIHGIPIPTLISESKESMTKMARHLENPESLLPIYLAFTVFDALVDGGPTSSLKSPTSWQNQTDANLSLILCRSQGKEPLNTTPFDEEVTARVHAVVAEMQRSQGGELHNIAALTGGMVAQEAIKVVTRQYVPVDNTCVFDGVGSRSEVLRIE